MRIQIDEISMLILDSRGELEFSPITKYIGKENHIVLAYLMSRLLLKLNIDPENLDKESTQRIVDFLSDSGVDFNIL